MRHAQTSRATASRPRSATGSAAGYRPTHVESYRSATPALRVRRREAVEAPAFTAYHERTTAEHETLANDLKAKGFGPLAVRRSSLGRQARLHRALGEDRSRTAGSWLDASRLRVPEVARDRTPRSNRHARLRGRVGSTTASRCSRRSCARRRPRRTQARHDLTAAEYQAEYERWYARKACERRP